MIDKFVKDERPLFVIAQEIEEKWGNVSPYARPYLDAMKCLYTPAQNYYEDSGTSVVLYFLSNATHWRGDDARRIKSELKAMV